MCKVVGTGEGFMLTQRSCDASQCLLCSRRGDEVLKRYVGDADLERPSGQDALSHVFKSPPASPTRTGVDHSVARDVPEHESSRLLEFLPELCGEGDLSGESSFRDHVVPQLSCNRRRETYEVRESTSDKRDKVIAKMDFRSAGGFFATATSCKELCIHNIADRGVGGGGGGQDESRETDSIDPRWVHRSSAKLSSLVWNNHSNMITVGDHYGELTRVDVETCHIVREVDEGNGSPVLDLKRNRHFDTMCLLTSTKSGTVKLWAEDLSDSLSITDETHTIPVCGVAFSPLNVNWIAMARSDSTVCVYDVRYVTAPLWTTNVGGSGSAVAHVDYCGDGDVVCSSLNDGISVWESQKVREGHLSMAKRPPLTFDSHQLTKHFVGLSVSEGDLIASGSEDGKAYVYSRTSRMPVTVCESLAGDKCVTAVEWIPKGQSSGPSLGLLVAQGSSIRRFEIDPPAAV
ncbi:WD40 repeat domain-containing protein [Chloropicon primus]|uniref:WD40 repeat domain-containing protein n=1 Tax=Chloropicon primus TaxID=1764295 RepID=A0A5B8MRZ9_9CHLO|nr:WD40 repeat domain-containing protein [Chloropicon primus]UPR02404.1 WD40 repeat domain-containing protein [Chloropicon primus]|eukprot:QDZ23191.1 WD40 repeat domain-containing protein [Chloropicon primus]